MWDYLLHAGLFTTGHGIYKAKTYKKTELDKKLCTLFCKGGIQLPQMIIGWFEFEHMGLGLWI